MKFTKTAAGTYTAGRFTISRTYCWELRLDGCEILGYATGYTSLGGAKSAAAEIAAIMPVNLDEVA